MKLDYIPNINAFGDNVVRLYDFDMAQAIRFRNAIQVVVVTHKMALDLLSMDFIQPRNCILTLRIADEDLGIVTEDEINFFCDLTMNGYQEMISLLEPFCKRETIGYQWLYDVDSQTDFLFSPGGTW